VKITLVEEDLGTSLKIRLVLSQSYPKAQITWFESLAEAAVFARENAQDFWLIDLQRPKGTGIDLINMVRDLFPLTYILVITAFDDAGSIANSIRAGANGYLLKEEVKDGTPVIQSLEAIRNGGTPLSPRVTSLLLSRMQVKPNPSEQSASQEHGLSPRELELLKLLKRGYTYAEAATMMNVLLSTVQTLIKRIYIKLGVNSRTQAIFEANALGAIN